MLDSMEECPMCGARMHVLVNNPMDFKARCVKNHLIIFRRGLEET